MKREDKKLMELDAKAAGKIYGIKYLQEFNGKFYAINTEIEVGKGELWEWDVTIAGDDKWVKTVPACDIPVSVLVD